MNKYLGDIFVTPPPPPPTNHKFYDHPLGAKKVKVIFSDSKHHFFMI